MSKQAAVAVDAVMQHVAAVAVAVMFGERLPSQTYCLKVDFAPLLALLAGRPPAISYS